MDGSRTRQASLMPWICAAVYTGMALLPPPLLLPSSDMDRPREECYGTKNSSSSRSNTHSPVRISPSRYVEDDHALFGAQAEICGGMH